MFGNSCCDGEASIKSKRAGWRPNGFLGIDYSFQNAPPPPAGWEYAYRNTFYTTVTIHFERRVSSHPQWYYDDQISAWTYDIDYTSVFTLDFTWTIDPDTGAMISSSATGHYHIIVTNVKTNTVIQDDERSIPDQHFYDLLGGRPWYAFLDPSTDFENSNYDQYPVQTVLPHEYAMVVPAQTLYYYQNGPGEGGGIPYKQVFGGGVFRMTFSGAKTYPDCVAACQRLLDELDYGKIPKDTLREIGFAQRYGGGLISNAIWLSTAVGGTIQGIVASSTANDRSLATADEPIGPEQICPDGDYKFVSHLVSKVESSGLAVTLMESLVCFKKRRRGCLKIINGDYPAAPQAKCYQRAAPTKPFCISFPHPDIPAGLPVDTDNVSRRGFFTASTNEPRIYSATDCDCVLTGCEPYSNPIP